MADRTIYHMGEAISLAKLVRHYRLMMRSDRRSVAFWRERMRVVIAQARFEAANADERIAA